MDGISRYSGDAWFAVHSTVGLEDLDFIGYEGERMVLHVPAARRLELQDILAAKATLEVEDVAAALNESFQAGRVEGETWEAWFHEWHPLSAIEAKLRNLAESQRATLMTLGTSAEGRAIHALHIAGAAAGTGAPEIVVNGCIHAREWISASTTIYVAEWLLRHESSELAQLAWTLIPVLNVDGYVYTWTNARLWRKNRQFVRPGCVGIDLNRNADIGWKPQTRCGGNTFPGQAPLDAVETRALRSFLQNRSVIAFFDLHAAAQLVLSPYAYTYEAPKAQESLRKAREAIAGAMNQVAKRSHRTSYGQGRAATMMYAAPGCIFDDAHANLGVPFSFAIELRGHHHFRQPAALAIQCGKELTAGFLAFRPILEMSLTHEAFTRQSILRDSFEMGLVAFLLLALCIAMLGVRRCGKGSRSPCFQSVSVDMEELVSAEATYLPYETDDEAPNLS